MKEIVKDINRNKLAGGDKTVNILKECEFEFSALADRINKLFETGIFPECLKETNVIPLLKKYDPFDNLHFSLRLLKIDL